MKKICFIVAVAGTAKSFLRDHIAALSEKYEITLVGDIQEDDDLSMLKIHRSHSIKICRNISLTQDFLGLIKLYRFFRKEKFDAVHSVTPKAGLLTSIAAFCARVPHRIHIFTGQVWATKNKGILLHILKYSDKLIAALNNHILVDGQSQRQFLIENNIIKEDKSQVLGKGSISGVNTDRFKPSEQVREEIRQSIGIGNQMIVYLFLGRLNKEKGIYELFCAFNKLSQESDNVFLLLVGSDEENCVSNLPSYPAIKDGINFHFYGLTPNPEILLQAGDVFCMPSYREGFGSSVIEASCLGIPVICSDAYGLRDAFIDHETGLTCTVADSQSLYQQMKNFKDNPELREKCGKSGRERVLAEFSSNAITEAWLQFYDAILSD